MCNKTPADNAEPQQIGYVNLVPRCTESGGLFMKPDFEDFSETIQRFNAKIAQRPVEG